MLEVLRFVFESFWHFIGTLVILWLIVPWGKIKIVNLSKREEEP